MLLLLKLHFCIADRGVPQYLSLNCERFITVVCFWLIFPYCKTFSNGSGITWDLLMGISAPDFMLPQTCCRQVRSLRHKLPPPHWIIQKKPLCYVCVCMPICADRVEHVQCVCWGKVSGACRDGCCFFLLFSWRSPVTHSGPAYRCLSVRMDGLIYWFGNAVCVTPVFVCRLHPPVYPDHTLIFMYTTAYLLVLKTDLLFIL